MGSSCGDGRLARPPCVGTDAFVRPAERNSAPAVATAILDALYRNRRTTSMVLFSPGVS